MDKTLFFADLFSIIREWVFCEVIGRVLSFSPYCWKKKNVAWAASKSGKGHWKLRRKKYTRTCVRYCSFTRLQFWIFPPKDVTPKKRKGGKKGKKEQIASKRGQAQKRKVFTVFTYLSQPNETGCLFKPHQSNLFQCFTAMSAISSRSDDCHYRNVV